VTVPTLLISAAEPSGDRMAADLVCALREHGEVDAFGLAGPHMRAAGVEAVAQMEDVCAMGVMDVLVRLPAILAAKSALRQSLKRRPNAALFVDAPDLHLPIAARAKSMGIPSIGWVSPQVWAWRQGRVGTVTEAFDQLLCLFDFEPDLYPNLETHFTGHPVLDRLVPRTRTEPHLYGLAPGSRPQEVNRMWPVFIEAAQRIQRHEPRAKFRVISPVPELPVPEWIERKEHAQDFAPCRGVLTKSGTITLELAVLGVPQAVAHKVHPSTAWLGRRLVRGIEHIAMPNVLAGNAVIPEFIQDLNPEDLATAVLQLPADQPIDLSALGAPGGVVRAAERVRASMGAS